jgi:hypothetical protein
MHLNGVLSRPCRHGRRRARGQAMIELLMALPVYAALFFGVWLLGDLMWMNAKVELAARYSAWKRQVPSQGEVNTLFFEEVSGVSPRVTLESVNGQRLKYPTEGEDRDTALQRRQITGIGGSSGSGESIRDLAWIDFEGNDGHYRNFEGDGGWVKEHRAVVRMRYNVVTFVSVVADHFNLVAGAVVLEGKRVETKLSGGGSFKFRDEDPQPPAGTTQPAVSGEEAGMIQVLKPSAP